MKLPQMIGYVRKFEGSKTISFKISNKQLLKKYNQMWKKVEKLLKINLNSEPIQGDNDKYITTKIKIYGSRVNANFQGKKVPKEKVFIQVFINNNVRFCCQSKENVLS